MIEIRINKDGCFVILEEFLGNKKWQVSISEMNVKFFTDFYHMKNQMNLFELSSKELDE